VLPPPARAETAGYQPSLFRDSFGPKVIPIPTLTPARDGRRDGAPRRPPRSATPRSNPRRSLHNDSQQTLDFQDDPGPLDLQVEAVIVCDAPVALPAHRMIAAVVDSSLVMVAVGVFFGIFYLLGGELDLTRASLPFFLGVTAVIALLYRLLWCLGNGDSPGMSFAGLHVVDFDGRRPNRQKRALRHVAGVLSLISAGLGLIWALVDEENLTWHDHISKTFPTPG
jgi:uncharacterized RDD family membrane protein YckC